MWGIALYLIIFYSMHNHLCEIQYSLQNFIFTLYMKLYVYIDLCWVILYIYRYMSYTYNYCNYTYIHCTTNCCTWWIKFYIKFWTGKFGMHSLGVNFRIPVVVHEIISTRYEAFNYIISWSVDYQIYWEQQYLWVHMRILFLLWKVW